MKFQIILFTVFIWALSTHALDKPTAGKVESAVKMLGDGSYKVRKKATQKLRLMIEADPEIAIYLEKYHEHKDPEVRVRIMQLTKNTIRILKWISPNKEKEMKSPKDGLKGASITFKNKTSQNIYFIWIDYEGNRDLSRKFVVESGEERTIAETYKGHVWLVVDEQSKGLGLYVAPNAKAEVIYNGKEKSK